MDYRATIKYVRTSPRKLRLIVDAIRPLSAEEALLALAHVPKAAAEPLMLAVASAVANAKNKQASVAGLRFKALEVSVGPALKRWHAVSRGQAHAFKKRMSHIRVVLTDDNKINT